MKIYIKFSLETVVEPQGYMVISPPSIIKCQDVQIKELELSEQKIQPRLQKLHNKHKIICAL